MVTRRICDSYWLALVGLVGLGFGVLAQQTVAAQFDLARISNITDPIRAAVLVPERAAQVAIEQEREVHEAVARASAAAKEEQVKLVAVEREAQEARDQFRGTFQKALAELKTTTDVMRDRYQTVFTGLAIAGVLFALLSSVLGFVKWSVTAGVCGLITTAVLTAPSIFSVRENLGFYSQISSQTYSLQIEANLFEHPSQADIDRWKDRFLKLAKLLESPPSVKDPDQLTRSIVQGS